MTMRRHDHSGRGRRDHSSLFTNSSVSAHLHILGKSCHCNRGNTFYGLRIYTYKRIDAGQRKQAARDKETLMKNRDNIEPLEREKYKQHLSHFFNLSIFFLFIPLG